MWILMWLVFLSAFSSIFCVYSWNCLAEIVFFFVLNKKPKQTKNYVINCNFCASCVMHHHHSEVWWTIKCVIDDITSLLPPQPHSFDSSTQTGVRVQSKRTGYIQWNWKTNPLTFRRNARNQPTKLEHNNNNNGSP